MHLLKDFMCAFRCSRVSYNTNNAFSISVAILRMDRARNVSWIRNNVICQWIANDPLPLNTSAYAYLCLWRLIIPNCYKLARCSLLLLCVMQNVKAYNRVCLNFHKWVVGILKGCSSFDKPVHIYRVFLNYVPNIWLNMKAS